MIAPKSSLSECLIVTAVADEFATEIGRLADSDIPVIACTTTDQALTEYTDQPILFGNPAMIAEVLPKMPNVQWIQSSWAGVAPLIHHARRDYVLTGVKDVFGPQMSEYVIGYLLAHELKIIARKHAQQKKEWSRALSGTLVGKRLGIMGTGSIGAHIAATAVSLGMTVNGLNRSGNNPGGFSKIFNINGLIEFLNNVDYLVSTLPQTPATHHLLNTETLSHLPRHACFINVGRSNIVDDQALVDALQNGMLAAAVLDVFDEEPLPQTSPLWDATHLTVTSHIAAISYPLLIVPIFIENYRRFKNGQSLQHQIDFDTGY